MGQESHRLGDGCGTALCWLGEDCLDLGRHTEDNSTVAIQPSTGEQRSVGQHNWERGDARCDRQCVVVAPEVMFDEGCGQVNGSAGLRIDKLDVVLDQFGKRDLVQPGQKRLFWCR